MKVFPPMWSMKIDLSKMAQQALKRNSKSAEKGFELPHPALSPRWCSAYFLVDEAMPCCLGLCFLSFSQQTVSALHESLDTLSQHRPCAEHSRGGINLFSYLVLSLKQLKVLSDASHVSKNSVMGEKLYSPKVAVIADICKYISFMNSKEHWFLFFQNVSFCVTIWK